MARKKIKVAAVLMIIHGGLIELGGCLAMIPVLIMGTDKFGIGEYFCPYDFHAARWDNGRHIGRRRFNSYAVLLLGR
jgi:hypothetical protein